MRTLLLLPLLALLTACAEPYYIEYDCEPVMGIDNGCFYHLENDSDSKTYLVDVQITGCMNDVCLIRRRDYVVKPKFGVTLGLKEYQGRTYTYEIITAREL